MPENVCWTEIGWTMSENSYPALTQSKVKSQLTQSFVIKVPIAPN